MKVEFEGGPADGLRREDPDDITVIFFTDIGEAAGDAPDPFNGESLGRMTYKITDRRTQDGTVIFEYAGSSDHVSS